MAYNKAKGGGVPIKGNPSTSGIHNPTTGNIDQPQNLGGSMMGLGERNAEALIGNISPGAGTKGGGLHEPIIKDDSAKVVARNEINSPYRTKRIIIGSSGAVAAGVTHFVASYGPNKSIDGEDIPVRNEDPCDRAANNAKWDFDYLPSDCDCCDEKGTGPCIYHFDIQQLGEAKFNTYVDPVTHKHIILNAIRCCIDHTRTYRRGDSPVWIEPAALTFLNNSDWQWDSNLVWDGSRFTFQGLSFLGDATCMDEDVEYVLNPGSLNRWKSRSNPEISMLMPNNIGESLTIGDVDESADYTWTDGSDIDKVFKQYIKHTHFDDPVGGNITNISGNRDKMYTLSPADVLIHASGYYLVDILHSDGNPLPISPPFEPRWWGGARSDHFFKITINSKEQIIEEQVTGYNPFGAEGEQEQTSPIPVGHKIKFSWGYTSDHFCVANPSLTEVTVNAYKSNGSWVDEPVAYDLTQNPIWTVNLVNNVWAIIRPDMILDEGQRPEVNQAAVQQDYAHEYRMVIPKYAEIDTGSSNLNKCSQQQVIQNPNTPGRCACGWAHNGFLVDLCGCYPELWDAVPEVTNNTNFSDFDSTWPYIREAHKNPIKGACTCLSADCL